MSYNTYGGKCQFNAKYISAVDNMSIDVRMIYRWQTTKLRTHLILGGGMRGKCGWRAIAPACSAGEPASRIAAEQQDLPVFAHISTYIAMHLQTCATVSHQCFEIGSSHTPIRQPMHKSRTTKQRNQLCNRYIHVSI